MKIGTLSSALLLFAISPFPAQAEGGKVGNGGVVFGCRDRIDLVEAWEAEDLGHPLSLGKKTDPVGELLKAYITRLVYFEESLAIEFSRTSEAILREITALEKDPQAPTRLVRFTRGPLALSMDSDEINAPEGCEKIQVVTQKVPQISGEKLYTFFQPVWSRMDNEMKALLIVHELWVGRSVALGYSTTTRPARLMNQFIGSPALSGSASVCDYMDQLVNAGMSRNGFTYGDFVFWDLTRARNSCYPSGRLQSSSAAYRDFAFADLTTPVGTKIRSLVLRVTRPVFAEDSDRWIYGSFAGETGVAYVNDGDGRSTTAPSPILSEDYLLEGQDRGATRHAFLRGMAQAELYGTFHIRGMSRVSCDPPGASSPDQQPYCNARPAGSADLAISPDGKISAVIRP